MIETFTDIALIHDRSGVYDCDLDSLNRDAKLTDGLYSALMVSLFSDRRARKDEVADPLKRRGWIGDLLSDVPGDLHGSGLWFYQQSRLTEQVTSGVEAEARTCLQWLIEDRLCSSVTARVVSDPKSRTITLNITLGLTQGGVSHHAFVLASATQSGLLTNS